MIATYIPYLCATYLTLFKFLVLYVTTGRFSRNILVSY
nr:ALPV-323 [Albatrosspox virus]